MKWRVALFIILAVITIIIWQSSKPSVILVTTVNSADIKQHADMYMLVDIDGHQPINSAHRNVKDNWQNKNLKALFDFYIAYYEQGEQKMWLEFDQYCHPLIYCVELRAFFQRYVVYKTKLQNLDTEKLNLASEFENRLDKLNLLRNELFSAHEIDLLFDNEESWDRLAIERLRINQDASLSRQQKTQLIKQQLEQLPEHMKAAVLPTQELRKIHQIVTNTVLNSSDEYNQLAAEFGDDAAQRLIAVNQSQQDWFNKVQLFQQRIDDMKQQFNPDTTDYSQAVTQLKQQMFEANEQKRLRVHLDNPKLIESDGVF
jgi:lipase chaperone LimK